MRRIFGCFIVFMIMITSQIFAGTVYYVDATNGNDLNDGLTEVSAWKIIAKVNAQSFSAGDFILFKRGEIWTGTTLNNPYSGLEGNPITFGAYGSGAKPIITLKDSFSGWDQSGNWTDNGSNVWYKTITYNPYRVWLSSTEYLKAETLNDVDLTSRWYYDSGANRLYVYATSNPATFYSDIEVPWDGSTNYAVSHVGGSYHTYENLDIRGGNTSVVIWGVDHFTFDNCDIGLYAGANGLIATYKTSEIFTEYLTVKNCTIESGYDFTYDYEQGGLKEGIYLMGGVNHSDIHNNTISNWGHSCILLATGPSGYPVTDNEIYDNIMESPNTSYCRAFATQGGNNLCKNNKIYRNLMRNLTVRSQINGNENEVYYNIIHSIRNTDITEKTNISQAFSLEGYGSFVCKDNKLYNNVIYDTDGVGIWFCDYGKTKTGNLIINNIIMDTGKDPGEGEDNIGLMIDAGGSVGANTYQNNDIYTSGVTNVVKYRGTLMSVASFNAEIGTAGDVIANNIGSDPLFVDTANGNFALQSTSPCIDAGKDVGLTEDYAGNTVPYGWGVDIGAYENPLGEGDFSLTITANRGGTTAPSPGTYFYRDGTNVTIWAIHYTGYEFTNWSGDVSSTDTPITITIDSDKSITANFGKIFTPWDETAKKGGCFIATAAYGSPLHPYVKILRNFRDTYLMPAKLGREIVNFYYKYCPFVANLIARHKVLKIAIRTSILPLVAFSYSMVHFGPIISGIILVSIFVLQVFLVLFLRRKIIKRSRKIL